MAYFYDHPRPALAVNDLIFSFEDKQLRVLLIQRSEPPFKGEWALPGGSVDINESLEDAARRRLIGATGMTNVFMNQLQTFGKVDRDPRGRTLAVAYYALVRPIELANSNAVKVKAIASFPVHELPELAFDHADMIRVAVDRFREEFKFKPFGFELLPEKFSLTELQWLFEHVTDQTLDKRNFRKKILNTTVITSVGINRPELSRRLATLYQFDKERFIELEEDGAKITFF